MRAVEEQHASRVWVASESTGTLQRIDPRTDHVAQILTLARPLAGIALGRAASGSPPANPPLPTPRRGPAATSIEVAVYYLLNVTA